MTIAHVEILVEELSMEAALRLIVPRVAGTLSFDIHPFQGKRDLLGQLPARLQGYARWLPDDWRIIVVVDRDGDCCKELKKQMEAAARGARLATRAKGTSTWRVANRLAIEELEAWFFGDWTAVQTAYPGVDSRIPGKRRFRDPDAIVQTWEALEKVLQRAGYFRTGLRKIEAARTIA